MVLDHQLVAVEVEAIPIPQNLQTITEKMEDLAVEVLGEVKVVMEVQVILLLSVHHKEIMAVTVVVVAITVQQDIKVAVAVVLQQLEEVIVQEVVELQVELVHLIQF